MIIDSKNVKIGDRLLITEQRGGQSGSPIEGNLQEISPNQKAVKINGVWYEVTDIKIFDLLCE
jgi:hypothetical protein